MKIAPSSHRPGGKNEVGQTLLEKILRNQALNAFWGPHFIFDGVSQGFAMKQILPVGETRMITIDLPGHSLEHPDQVDVIVRHTGTLDIKYFVEYMWAGDYYDPFGDKKLENTLKWLGALFRKSPASRFITRPKNNAYYEGTNETLIPLESTNHILEAWRGWSQSVSLRFGRLYIFIPFSGHIEMTPRLNFCRTLNVDTSTTAFWTQNVRLKANLCATRLTKIFLIDAFGHHVSSPSEPSTP
jgi:Argonaute linker 1 domain